MAKDIFLYVFSLFIIACTVCVGVVLVFHPVPKENHDSFIQISGAIIAWGGMVVGYWVGSSKGSADKTKLLEAKAP